MMPFSSLWPRFGAPTATIDSPFLRSVDPGRYLLCATTQRKLKRAYRDSDTELTPPRIARAGVNIHFGNLCSV